jgi:hypothetical protein
MDNEKLNELMLNGFGPVFAKDFCINQYELDFTLLMGFMEWMDEINETLPMQLETDNDDIVMMYLDEVRLSLIQEMPIMENIIKLYYRKQDEKTSK